MGGVCLDASPNPLVFSKRVPDSVRRLLSVRKNQIAPYETLAVYAALVAFGARLRGRRVVFFIDNTTALGVIRNGFVHSDARDLRRLVSLIWLTLAQLQLEPHFEWVASNANLADGPSRPSSEAKNAELRTLHPTVLPPFALPESLKSALAHGVAGT